MRDLWVEKYRPDTTQGYVFRDQAQKDQVQEWIDSGAIPHLLFSGVQGAGKTTLAKLLINELGTHDFDVKMINASSNNGVDYIRDSVEAFATVMPYGDFKYIILDEADYLSPSAQAALRGVMEKYSSSLRFILTCATGDTKVITPEGLRRIDEIAEGDNVKSFDGFLANKFVKKSIAQEIITIKTEHGHSINVTPEHKFFTLSGERTAKNLTVGQSLPLYIEQLYGNEHDAETIDYEACFSTDDFASWLISNGVSTNADIEWVKENSKFVFNKAHRKIFDYLIDTETTSFNLVTVADHMGLSRATVRNFLSKITEYISNREFVCQSEFVYTIDLLRLKEDYQLFVSYISDNNIDTSHLLRYAKNYLTVENIVASIRFIKLNSDLLLRLGRITGFIEGDGHLSTTLHLAANNADTLRKVHGDISTIVDVKLNISKNGIDSKGLCSYYNSKPLKMLLEYIGVTVGNKTQQQRVLPDLCKHKLFFKGFLQGLYDADGKSISVLKDNISVSPVLLTQSISNDLQISYFDEIAHYAKMHFGIEFTSSIKPSYSSTFIGTDNEMHLYAGDTDNIAKFLGAIGNYYDKRNNTDIFGYLKYKQSHIGTHPMAFDCWKTRYFGHGIINDNITEVTRVSKEVEVYDCCFENVHWYITNGLMSHNCNYPQKIIPAIHSRCQGFHIANLDKTEYTARVAEILITESVDFELEVLDIYVKTTYPDMRKCINLCQQNVKGGKLMSPNVEDGASESDYQLMMVALFKEKKFKEARDLICKQVSADEYEDLFRFMYTNLEFWAEGDENKEDQCILVIRNGLVKHISCADAEINTAATLIELEMIANG